jgi:hypothetical protein
VKTHVGLIIGFVLSSFPLEHALAGDHSAATDWLNEARFGVFMHFLPSNDASAAKVHDFDVDAVAKQLQSAGARYFVLTLGQNSGYFNSPNRTYDQVTGYRPGERCSTRDLPMALYEALHPRGIRLMLYLPCQVPNRDARAQGAFGLPRGAKDQPIDVEFAKKWAAVIQEWSVRYESKVAGWWFDGGYEWIGFNNEIADIYANAAKKGNPQAIVTFNPGVKLIRWMRSEDYTAGELNDPFDVVPQDRWVDGSQWHALTYLGSHWGDRDVRFAGERWATWAANVTKQGGVVTLDAGPNWNPIEGGIGTISDAQMVQLQALRSALVPLDSRSFLPVENEFHFDTGMLRGTLHAQGRSWGLLPAQHVPSGTPLAASAGLLSPYRLLTPQARFGSAAWDWPSQATRLDDGAVQVRWTADADHPLDMTGVYRLAADNTVDLELTVCPTRDLQRFELFLASYFDGFPRCFAFVQRNGGKVELVEANPSDGDWQMFPRDDSAVETIRDRRWQYPPHPVDWVIRERMAMPLAVRRDAERGLSALIMAPTTDCFAVAMPYGDEAHRSLYLSLFGKDLKAGESAAARARLMIGTEFTEEQAIDAYREYERSIQR